ncbi:metallophosphoesterase family protein [Desulfosporosinus youngiae]|uniref:Putative phosphohydrolase n=1 Tax=Desulfosporosinus youngiae DSM 17734 TaxID=768710 RepID=H5XUT2_9FIRM|nr:metallophosphoesterase [Desulfosporosinus youngiae]EHQ89239.1 putative phosphohydrolase [Desulfosporosinus youngiae DSM 17734]
MRRLLLLLCIMIVSGLSLFNNETFVPPDKAANSQASSYSLVFAVIGDVHANTDSLEKAIRDLHTINPELNALIFNGDTVDQGIKKQYDALEKTLLKTNSMLPKTIIKNIGNHEFFNYDIEINSPQDVRDFINRYLEFADVDKVYHDTWVNGYHFISLGSEDGNSQTLDSIRAYISDEQRKWLTGKLAENYVPGKPIFVFLHQPLNSNPSSGWVGSDQSEEIRKILAQYPEVILFSSHTHADLTEKSVVLNQPFTKVHTGAIHYTIVRHAQEQSRTREPFIKGLYVEVMGNKVIIKGRNMKDQSWIFTQEINGVSAQSSA